MKRIAAFSILLGLAAAPVSAQAPPRSQAAGASSSVASYRINPGDDLEIFVWGEERLQRTVRVLPDGTFSFPLVGKVNALNSLPTEVETKISAGLEAQYRGAVPQVTVSVRTTTGMQFSVIGKVRNPGTFTPGRYVNALEALSFAGGPTEFAQLGNIIIVRKAGSGLQSVDVSLGDALKGSSRNLSSSAIPQIQGGDTVVVP